MQVKPMKKGISEIDVFCDSGIAGLLVFFMSQASDPWSLLCLFVEKNDLKMQPLSLCQNHGLCMKAQIFV
jgi:hypothetical protein